MPPSEGELFSALWGAVKGIAGLPEAGYLFIRELIDDVGSKAVHNTQRPGGERNEVNEVYHQLSRHADIASARQKEVCQRVAERVFELSPEEQIPPVGLASCVLLSSIIQQEGIYAIPRIDPTKKRSTAEAWELSASLRRQLEFFQNIGKQQLLEKTLEDILRCISLFNIPASDGEPIL